MTDPNDIIYHYCPAHAFYEIVRTKVLWLTDMFLTNDSEEHRWLRKIAARVIEEQKGQPGTLDTDFIELLNTKPKPVDLDERVEIYLACFSKHPDSLGQWRAYAEDGQGFAIGFSRQYLLSKRANTGHDVLDFDLEVFDVVYTTSDQEKLVLEAIGAAKKQWRRCCSE